jgi:YidC/Oxa1 family membrane protein insertase
MDTQRLILSLIFAGSLFMLWQAWEKEHAPKLPQFAGTADKSGATGNVPSLNTPGAAPTTGAIPPGGPAAVPTAAAPVKTERVTVTTDYLVAEIDSLGGTLTRLEFTQHHLTGDPRDLLCKILSMCEHKELPDPSKRFALLEDTPEHVYVAQSGLIGSAAPGVSLPNHRSLYSFEPGPRELKDGDNTLEIRLDASAGPVKVTKVYVFHRSSYVVDVRFEIANQGAAAVNSSAYFQITRDTKAADANQRFVSTFTGPAFYTGAEKYHKVEFADIDKDKAKIPPKSDNGWVAMLQHYFVTAWLLPKSDGQSLYEFYAEKVSDNLYRTGAKLPLAAIAPGASASIDVPLYSGPEEQDKLAEAAPGLELVIDYGWLTIIAHPLFGLLRWLHQWVHNWGVAIILLTVIVKALFFPLSAASYKSMARMRVLSPRLAKLKEQYGEDRVKMNQAMMELYKTEKINPLGGCLPILVQIPVFISLYWVLLAVPEMRNASFLYIHDLSARDPFCILPIIMTTTSYIQILLNPTPPDPAQAMVMKIMPLAFGVMFFFFPAGLVLYWVVNNVLSIAQQWQITRMIERGKDIAKR